MCIYIYIYISQAGDAGRRSSPRRPRSPRRAPAPREIVKLYDWSINYWPINVWSINVNYWSINDLFLRPINVMV